MTRSAQPFPSPAVDPGAAAAEHASAGPPVRQDVPGWLRLSLKEASWGDLARAGVGSVAHAVGQGGLALAIAALAPSLAARSAAVLPSGVDGVMDGRSMFAASDGGVLSVVVVALAASGLEAVGAALAGAGEARVAFGAGARLRVRYLRGWLAWHRLRSTRHADHGGKVGDVGAPGALDAVAARVRDVERGVLVGALGGARALVRLAPLLVLLVHLGRHALAPAALALVALVVGLAAARRRLRRGHARAEAARLELVRAADEAVRHAELWANYGAEERALASLARAGSVAASRGVEVHVTGQVLAASSQVLGALALAGVLVLRELTGRPAEVTPVLVLAAVAFLAYRPVRELVDAASARAAADAAWSGLAPVVGLGEVESEVDADVEGEVEGAPAPGGSTGPRDGAAARLGLAGFTSRHGRHPPVDADVPAGALVAIVGANGVGKTSLLRALAGLDAGASGRVAWGGRALDDAAAGPRTRPFVLVPTDPPLLAGTLRENVLVGPAADESLARAREVLALAGLDGALDEPIGPGGRALSAGERRVVGLARAVATGAPCLLVDEPTVHLDDVRAASVLACLLALRGARTVVVATHDARVRAAADVTLALEARDLR